MRVRRRWCMWPVLLCMFAGRLAWAQAADQAPKDQSKEGPKEAATTIDFADPTIEKEESEAKEREREGDVFYAPPIELFFQNPAIQANLNGGIDELNRSVENLMDQVFYSIMDNETDLHINPFAWFHLGLTRKLFSTPTGAYVVIDRFLLGPVYNRALWTVQNIPITLGVDGLLECEQIYLRTDGMRVAQEREMGTLRRMVNNWFGLVPALTAILPPSFNQNYLYDPLTELATPFSFPLNVDAFSEMPVGSIRSYALSGGIRVSPDMGGLLPADSVDLLNRIGGLGQGVPYSIFQTGAHRINVLRRDEHTAWVGVNNTSRTGVGTSPYLGQKYFLLRGAIMVEALGRRFPWVGVPAPILPINIQMEQAFAKLFDQVYAFDLRIPAAQEAYRAAVRGDFSPAHDRYLDAKEKSVETGVTFLFNRAQNRQEDVATNGPNVAFYRNERRRTLDHGTIDINDPEGHFYILESTLNVEDKKWNLLVGEDQARTQQTIEMKVKKLLNKDATDSQQDFTYIFEKDPEPYRLQMNLNIQDRYVDTIGLASYLAQLRFFAALPMAGLPLFDEREADKEADWRQADFFASPKEQVQRVHVTPTYLGHFAAQAALNFPFAQLKKIVASTEDQLWAAFAKAYGHQESAWGSAAGRASFTFQSQWYKAFFFYPLRLFNVRFAEMDAINEATKGVKALLALKALDAPITMIEGFRDLLDTDHPEQLAQALFNLSDPDQIARKVILSAQPQSSASQKIKAAFGMINNKMFRAGPPFPQPDRYAKAKAALSKFYLNEPKQFDVKPRILKIQVTSRPVPASIRSLETIEDQGKSGENLDKNANHVFINFGVGSISSDGPLKVYVRVEEAGKLKLGKLSLAENVIELTPLEGQKLGKNEHSYEFFLTGPLSPINNDKLSEAVNEGDQFQVILAVSKDEVLWSDERTLEFTYQNGYLFPVKK